jgi:Domain of unknown function (DUF6434)/SAP domain-containing new25
MKRPEIETIKSGVELKKWYWLKAELVEFCKVKSISYTGGKFVILERIADTLDGKSNESKSVKGKSTFNWAKEHLTINTIITDSYTNGQNARQFFKEHCGGKFRFSIAFMSWMKANVGKTLKDAVAEWKSSENFNKVNKSKIPLHNQYNQYIRDFFADNPGKTMEEARRFWNLKKQLPIGRHQYERSDLELG